MKKTLNVYDLKKEFVEADRDYYSLDGLEALLDYYNEIDENMELDVIAICCDCTEYGENTVCSFEDLKNDYGYLYPVDEWLDDNNLSENEFDIDNYIKSLVEVLEEKTAVLYISNGNYIVFSF